MPRYMKRRKTSSRGSRKSSRSSRVRGHGAYRKISSHRRYKKKSSRIRGHGAYKKVSKKSSKKHKTKRSSSYLGSAINVGRMAGKLGSYLGSPTLMGIGAASNALGQITGHGDYAVRANTLSIPGTQIPSFDSRGRECVRVRHREYCFDLLSSTSPYSVTPYSLNPCNTILFPYLATVASQFQEYSWSGLIFEARSESGMAVSSTNTSLGYIAIATDYDASNGSTNPSNLQPAFIDKQQMLNSEFAVDGVPSSNILHIIECDRKQTAMNNLYTNTGYVPSGADIKLYDIGQLDIAVGNQQASGNVLASFWASYDICLYKPIIGYTGANQNATHYTNTTGITLAGSAPSYFGNASSIVQQTGSTFQLSFGQNTITFPPSLPTGNYLLEYVAHATNALANTANTLMPTLSNNINSTAYNLYNAGVLNTYDPGFSAVGGQSQNLVYINYPFTTTGSSVVLNITGGNGIYASGGAINAVDLIVNQLPSVFS